MPQFTGTGKATYVREMFGGIAQRYDLLNTFMSLGRDKGWRRQAVAMADPPESGLALDVATGTGEIAFELAQRTEKVIGLDFCSDMLALAEAKARRLGLGSKVSFILGDALALPFADNTFDCATIGFGTRNVVSVVDCFAEMRRVVKPGGRVVCLELTHPRSHLFSSLYGIYLRGFIPALGRWISGHREAYSYLPASLAGFPSPQGLQALMERAGLQKVSYKPVNFHTIALHLGVK